MVRIDKDYKIGVDNYHSYILVKGEPKITIDKKGRKTKNQNILGYFTKIEHLLNAYLDYKIKEKISDETISDIRQLKSEIESLKETVKHLLKTEL